MRWCSLSTSSDWKQDEISLLVDYVRDYPGLERFLNLGPTTGEAVSQVMGSLHNHPKLVIIDPMISFSTQMQVIRSNLASCKIDLKNVDIRVKSSQVALREASASGETYDCILIEGVYKIYYLMQCLQWARMLNINGILCLHNYSTMSRSVWIACHRFLKKHKNYRIEKHVGNLLVIRKTGKSNFKEISFSDHLYALAFSPLLHLDYHIRRRGKIN